MALVKKTAKRHPWFPPLAMRSKPKKPGRPCKKVPWNKGRKVPRKKCYSCGKLHAMSNLKACEPCGCDVCQDCRTECVDECGVYACNECTNPEDDFMCLECLTNAAGVDAIQAIRRGKLWNYFIKSDAYEQLLKLHML